MLVLGWFRVALGAVWVLFVFQGCCRCCFGFGFGFKFVYGVGLVQGVLKACGLGFVYALGFRAALGLV